MEHIAHDMGHKIEDKNRRALRARGFSLVELFVSIAIFIVIIGAVVINQNKFADNLLTSDVAYDVASAVREAQSYGMNVKNAGPVTAPNYNNGYGVHIAAVGSSPITQLTLFNDQFVNAALDAQGNQISGNHTCDNNCDPTSSEYIKSYTLNHNDTIQKFCGLLPGDSWPQAGSTDTRLEECNDSQTNPLTYLDIAFTRPNPDAFIVSNQSPTDPTTHLPLQRYIGARIYVASPSGTQWVEETGNSGQISVKSMPGIGFRPPPTPTVTVSASPNPVAYGGAPVLSWTSTRATNCSWSDSSGVWSGSGLTNPSNVAGAAQTSADTYTVTCTGSGGSVSSSVTVNANQPYTPPPQPTYISRGQFPNCSQGVCLIITSPTGGETWSASQSHIVSYTTTGAPINNVNISNLCNSTGCPVPFSSVLGFVNNSMIATINSSITPGQYFVRIAGSVGNTQVFSDSGYLQITP